MSETSGELLLNSRIEFKLESSDSLDFLVLLLDFSSVGFA